MQKKTTEQENEGDKEPPEDTTPIDLTKDDAQEESQAASSDQSKDADPKSKLPVEDDMARWVEMGACVDMLNRIDWLVRVVNSDDNWNQLEMIFQQGMVFCRDFCDKVLHPWNVDNWPRNPQLWLGEMERVLMVMQRKRWIPYWLYKPSDHHIRKDAAESAAGFDDPGNYVLDVVVHALRLWNYCEPSRLHLVIQQPICDYGGRANRSAKGPVNLRGNIIEAMTKNLQQTGSEFHNGLHGDYDTLDWWYYQGWFKRQENAAVAAYWKDTRAASSSDDKWWCYADWDS